MSLSFQEITSALPESGLRAGAQWLFSPKPFELTKSEAKKITSLGHVLASFQRASDTLYQRSAMGRIPSWIADTLDAGKPEWMIHQQRSNALRDIQPRVIRPDLILTESGFALTELDSVPGGMGITAWLSQLYADAGNTILGGKEGMLEGFQKLMPEGGRILISEESADYRPEMEWLATQLGETFHVETAENATATDTASYRFFEWFDWENIPASIALARQTNLTSPCKPHLEEKLWLALLWSPALKKLWQQTMREKHLQRLKEIIPFGWVVNPEKLPAHAALPRLDAHSWDEVAEMSQKKRRLVLKISGFSELAWGSKSVQIGHDMPRDEWSAALKRATNQFDTQPWVMQQYHAGRVIEHPYFDPETHEIKTMQGRVRLCPYYFTDLQGETKIGGALATIVPADKKKIHGMKDGILVPCTFS